MYAKGNQLPVVTDVNLINPVGSLADGRPIYSATANAATRLDPRFNHILEVQSIGESEFKSVTFQTDVRPSGADFGNAVTVTRGWTVMAGSVSETSPGVLTWTPVA